MCKALNSANARNQICKHDIEKGRVRRRNHIATGKYIDSKEWGENSREFLDYKTACRYLGSLKTIRH